MMDRFDYILKVGGAIVCAALATISLVASFCGYPWHLATFAAASIAAMLIYKEIKDEQDDNR